MVADTRGSETNYSCDCFNECDRFGCVPFVFFDSSFQRSRIIELTFMTVNSGVL